MRRRESNRVKAQPQPPRDSRFASFVWLEPTDEHVSAPGRIAKRRPNRFGPILFNRSKPARARTIGNPDQPFTEFKTRNQSGGVNRLRKFES
jgi:hypothetical protein